jgi:hypothetical protein
LEKKDLIIGFLIGVLLAFIGAFLVVYLFTNVNLFYHYEFVKQQGILGKVITLGAILNIITFFILLKIKKEMMARGIILSLFVLTFYTIIL